jgi:FMN phosphatase YigB (HAD superfamily)
MSKPAVLLFDLGGVLVENSHFEDLPKLLPLPLPEGDLHDQWLSSASVRRFERGETGADEFSSAFVLEWGLTMAPSAFMERFAAWPKGFFSGAGPMLTRLRRNHKIVYLSNSNEVHWSGFGSILQHADIAYASHICGLVKPDPAIFRLVISELGHGPGEISFFDDSPRNVESARAIGIDAHLTIGFHELRSKLQTLGLD